MKPEAQNAAIAKWMGRPYHKPTEEEIKSGCYYQYEPNYTGCLNAMHEAEKRLTRKQWYRYTQEMEEVLERDTPESERGNLNRHFMSATAAQRAEALLRTIGKWEES